MLARFGLKHPSRCLGLVLINCTGSAATVLETFKTKFISWKSEEVGQGAEDFLLYHKFGHVSSLDDETVEIIFWMSDGKLFFIEIFSVLCLRFLIHLDCWLWWKLLQLCLLPDGSPKEKFSLPQSNYVSRDDDTPKSKERTQSPSIWDNINFVYLSINVGDLLIFFFSCFSLPQNFLPKKKFLFLFCCLFSCFIRLVCKRNKHKLARKLMLCGRRYTWFRCFALLIVITHTHVMRMDSTIDFPYTKMICDKKNFELWKNRFLTRYLVSSKYFYLFFFLNATFSCL